MEHLERPVQRTPSGSFRARALSASRHARVARQLRGNGQPVIAGGRWLAAGIMPPPSSLSITRSSFRKLTWLTFVRTCGLADLRTCGLADLRFNDIGGVLQIMQARRGSGGHRPPPRWQVTVRECRECPVQRTPSGSFRAHATSANHHVRVARASRMNGHTAIAGGRCLDAGFMPPPSLIRITRSSVRSLRPVVRFPDFNPPRRQFCN